MVLIYIPTIYVCVSNFFKSLDSDNKGLGLRSLFTILIPFPIIQTMFNFVALRIIPRRYKSKILSIIKPTYVASVEDDQETSNGRKLKIDEEKAMKEIFEVEDMKADLKTAGTFYNSCPSICLQVHIIIVTSILFSIFLLINQEQHHHRNHRHVHLHPPGGDHHLLPRPYDLLAPDHKYHRLLLHDSLDGRQPLSTSAGRSDQKRTGKRKEKVGKR